MTSSLGEPVDGQPQGFPVARLLGDGHLTCLQLGGEGGELGIDGVGVGPGGARPAPQGGGGEAVGLEDLHGRLLGGAVAQEQQILELPVPSRPGQLGRGRLRRQIGLHGVPVGASGDGAVGH